jgi:hypothetical protein
MILDGKDLDIQTSMIQLELENKPMLMVFSMENKVIEGFL